MIPKHDAELLTTDAHANTFDTQMLRVHDFEIRCRIFDIHKLHC